MGTPVTVQNRPIAGPGWRARLGIRAQIGTALVLLMVIGLFAGNAYLSQQYGPEGAVRHYFAAVESGDASGAFADLEIGALATKTDATAVDQAAMAAALRSSRPRFPSLDVGSASVSGSLAILTASYHAAGGRTQLHLTLSRANGQRQLGVYPRWRIAVLPGVLKVTMPTGSSGILLDGVRLALAPGRTSTAAVLPMPHTVSLPGTDLLEGQAVAIDATVASADGYPVAFTPKLTAAGQSKATAVIKDVFVTCSASTSGTPPGCPQTYDNKNPVSYELIGDPAASLAFGTDKQGQLTASGHYLFVVTGTSSNGATAHGITGNGYTAQLHVTTSNISVAAIADDNSVAPAPRPAAAADQAARDLVQKGFATCAAATDAWPVDCPQKNVFAYRQSRNVRWVLTGDPLAGSAVTWDRNLGALEVKGSFGMSIDYDGTFPGAGHYREASDTKSYAAFLIVDGSSLRLIFIGGVF